MLEQRKKGCFWTFGLLLMAANGMLYLLYVLIEQRLQFFRLNDQVQLHWYLLGIPFAYLYCLSHLRRIFEELYAPSVWHSLLTSLRMVMVMGVTYLCIYFFLKDVNLSRLFIFSYLPLSWIFNFVLILYGPPLLSRVFFMGGGRSRAILFGHGPLPANLRRYIEQARVMGVKFIGYYADEQLDLTNIQWLGKAAELLTCEGGRKRVRTELVFAYSDNVTDGDFKESIERCIRSGARVNIYSNLSNLFIDPVRIVTDGPVQFITFYDEPLQNPVNLFIKRVIDIVLSLPVVLFVLPPLCLFVWIGHRIQSPGPLFFTQARYGMNRKPFRIYKFRTMHVHDRKMEGQQATKGDKRIFPFGQFLRKYSIDEFPQFLNALYGNMSVVGPRPHFTNHDEAFEKYYRRYRSRHYVKPGITGLAQVSGYRGETATEEDIIGRARHDIQYVTQWSIRQELYIVLKTAWQFINPPKKAY